MLVMSMEGLRMMVLVVAACREAGELNEYGVLPFGADVPKAVQGMVVMCRRLGDIQNANDLSVCGIIRAFMREEYRMQEVAA